MEIAKQFSKWTAAAMACMILFVFTSCKEKANSLTDPEIASVAVTANQIDINYGKIALMKSSNPAVKHFAESMVKDHQNIIDQAVALAQKLGVTPKDNAVTQSLLDGEKKTTAKLNSLEGKAFDEAYIKNEVAYHQAVIDAVKNTLIPQSSNAQLKDLLTQVVPLLEAHLKMAQAAEEKIVNAPEKPAVPQLNDAQIASVAVVANQVDVNYGKIALEKSKNEKVRHFAQSMVTDHTNIINQAVALAKKLGVTPEDNAVSQSLLKGEKETSAKLNSLEGDAFDAAYINNEVAYHKAVIDAVKNILIPQTQNAELKSTLEAVAPLLEEHLKMAEKAQAEIVK